jgi:F-type H+-transporting ATPase subunit delta
MNQSAITVRYAKAFSLLANEKNLQETLKSDIELLYSVCNTSPDFIFLLESPIVKTSKKIELFTSIFSGKINEITLSFLKLIAENKRESHIPGICRNFLELIRKNQNIKSAVITTASKIDDNTIKKIETLMSEQLNSKIELSNKIDFKIIGGIILRVEDMQYDASVATQLKKIKQTLLETDLKK